MGRTEIVLIVAAVVVAIVCFAVGFLYGRSNLKARIEQALEDGHGGLDFREFAIRQQLDEAVAEVARLRPLAEEYGRVQERLRREQAQYEQMKTDFDATLKGVAGADSGPGERPRTPQEQAPVSADEAIQKLLKSLEQTLQEPETQPHTPVEPAPSVVKQPAAITPQPPMVAAQPSVATAQTTIAGARPPVPRAAAQPASAPAAPAAAPRAQRPPASTPKPVNGAHPKPEAKAPQQKPDSPSPGVDEWQEFARSLADLTRRNQ
jgi:hypothetical protein